jgi:hypothetical protein
VPIAPTDLLAGEAQVLAANLGFGGNFATETIEFTFTSAAILSFVARWDGWIAGWKSNYSLGLGIGINVVPPSSTLTTHGITTGLVQGPWNNQDALQMPGEGIVRRYPFKENDTIYVRPLVAGTGFVHLVIGRTL